MSRPLRIQYPGALYHIMSRGNAGNIIYHNDANYRLFLDLYKKTIEDYNWTSYAYCLMPNHYHLFIKTIDANLSMGMQKLNSDYAQKSNIMNDRYGHVFQGRYKSVLVENLGYGGELTRYIILNPIEAKLTNGLSQWRWTSHREVLGLGKLTGCVHVNDSLSIFGESEKVARIEYLKHLERKCKNDNKRWQEFRLKSIVGSKKFVENVMDKYLNCDPFEIIKKERLISKPPLEDIFQNVSNKSMRNIAIKEAYKKYGYTQEEIGIYLRLHRATVSRLVNEEDVKC